MMGRLGSALVLWALLSVAGLASTAAWGQERGVRRQDDRVYFNLQNVDIRTALESISEVLGISYVMGGNVPPNQLVTINTAEGIPVEEVPDLLDSVLRTYNLTLVRTGDVFTVIQAQTAAGGAAGAGPTSPTQVFVYTLRNANAVDLANVLSQLFQGGAPPGGFERRSPAGRSLSRNLEDQRLDFEPAREPEREPTVVITPDAGRAAAEAGARAAVISGELIGQTTIVPDETTNSLIIRTAPENYPPIEETIRKLDIRPLQVLIEVTIAEITLDESTQFGIDFLITQTDLIGDEDTRTEIELEDLNPPTGGLRVRIFDSADVDATLRALAADSRVNVLSTPRIIAVNNKEARILVGSEVPFVQFQRSTIGENVDRVVQFRNVGLELTVVPRINPDRYISMELLQQVSSLTADVLFDAPIITTREAETSLVVGDRQTVVLGGLIEDRKEKRKSGIPILKDIPVLGLLFGSTSTRTVKTELVITLTPYIVGSDMEIETLRGQLEAGTEFYKEELEKRAKEGRPVPGRPGPSRERGNAEEPAPAPEPAAVDTATTPGAVQPLEQPGEIPAAPPPAPDVSPPPSPPPDTTASMPISPNSAATDAQPAETPGRAPPDTLSAAPDAFSTGPDTLSAPSDTLPAAPR
jgi:type II secretory pathway component GspD/PulD (secretin)